MLARCPACAAVVQTQSGVVVLADSWWQARQARDALEIEWDPGAERERQQRDDLGRPRECARDAQRRSEGRARRRRRRRGAGRRAARRSKPSTSCRCCAHATLEPQNCTVVPDGDTLHVYAPTQVQQSAQAAAAAAAGIAARARGRAHDVARRRLRPQARGRLHPGGRRSRARRERAREAAVDARGRHDARLLPPAVSASLLGGARQRRRDRRLEVRDLRAVGHEPLGAGRRRERDRSVRARGRDQLSVRRRQRARHVLAARDRHRRRVSALREPRDELLRRPSASWTSSRTRRARIPSRFACARLAGQAEPRWRQCSSAAPSARAGAARRRAGPKASRSWKATARTSRCSRRSRSRTTRCACTRSAAPSTSARW